MSRRTAILKAPFPYFGGKSRVAAEVWRRFGDAPNFVDPFCGSLAVPLARPHPPGTETVNDADGWLTNLWRSIRADPDGVAAAADWPVSELDLHARGGWLFYRPDAAAFVERMRADPDYYDVKSAGWWMWGASAWIGTGWGPRENRQLPHVGNAGRGVNRKLPHVGDAGRGVNRQMPHVGDAGQGVNRQMPHVGDAGQDEIWLTPTGAALRQYMRDLSARVRRMRICCGDWTRVLGPSVTHRHGTTAVLLDPPYGEGAMDYAAGGNVCGGLARDVRDWAVANGDNSDLRIALCGYEGAYEMPASWECFAWVQRKGYGKVADDGSHSGHRERIWFSPFCVRAERQLALFGVPAAEART